MREEICAEGIYVIEPIQKGKLMWNLFMRITNKHEILQN